MDVSKMKAEMIWLQRRFFALSAKADEFRERGLEEAAQAAEDNANKAWVRSEDIWCELDEAGFEACMHDSVEEIFECVYCSDFIDEVL